MSQANLFREPFEVVALLECVHYLDEVGVGAVQPLSEGDHAPSEDVRPYQERGQRTVKERGGQGW